MPMLSAAALLVAAQTSSALPLLSDREFCALLQRKVPAMSGQSIPPAKFGTVRANCVARRVEAKIDVALNGTQLDDFVNRFVAAAKSGVCNLNDPTMKAFADRGWKFEYIFTGSDRRVVPYLLTC